MFRQNRWLAAAFVAGISVAGCKAAGGAQPAAAPEPASVTTLGSGQLPTVKLTADAAARIGLHTAKVTGLSAKQQQAVVPGSAKAAAVPRLGVAMAAVLYDHNGATWVYSQTAPLTFQRQSVVVSRVDGDLALLSSGPAAGTAVATVGAAELRGSEDGVSGE